MIRRRSILAAILAAPVIALSAPAVAAANSMSVLDDAILDDGADYVWITCSSIGDKTKLANDLFRHLSGRRPVGLYSNGYFSYCNAGEVNRRTLSVSSVRLVVMKYAIIDDPKNMPLPPEGDFVALARKKTQTFHGGKAIVLSPDAPPSHLRRVRHIRL